MFTTVEQIKTLTGYDVESQTVLSAQLIIETWVGRSEGEVADASDLSILGRATIFQAVYMHAHPAITFEQFASLKEVSGESSSTPNNDMFSPFISPWAWRTCQKLSWMGSRSIHTGPTFDSPRPYIPTWSNN